MTGEDMEASPRDILGAFIRDDLLSGKDVSDDDSLLLSGLVDSLGVMRLVSFIEATFAITVPASDLRVKNFASINAIASYVTAKSEA